MNEFILNGGPQDGAIVCRINGMIPNVIYVAGSYADERHSSWARDWSNRFPARYEYVEKNHYVFRDYKRKAG